jgi:hypothetical protein
VSAEGVRISWPALLQYVGDDELLYVASLQDWDNDRDLHACRYEAEDRLIDSAGQVFSLVAGDTGRVHIQELGERLDLASVLELVRAHESQMGSCCVAKLYANSIVQAIEMLKP